MKTHSNFIYELLDSKGSHNQGHLFLKLFIEQVLNLSGYGDIEKVKAYQECLTEQHRRIDFVIETEKYQIGIEMKIDAKDQDMQLADYMTELKRAKKEERLYYLTLRGNEASQESIGDNEIDYKCLSFEDNIYNWILTCIEKSVAVPLLREGLTHYKNLISIITNKISEPMEKEMEELINTPNEVEAVQTMLNEYPRIWAKKEIDFLDKLNAELENIYTSENFELIDIYDIWTDKNDNKYPDIIENLIKLNTSGFVLQKEYQSGTWVNLYFEISKGETFLSIGFLEKDMEEIKINKVMKNVCDNLSFKHTNGNYRYKNIEEDIVFFNANQTTLTYDLFDEDKFNTYILEVAKEIKAKIIYLSANRKIIIEALSA